MKNTNFEEIPFSDLLDVLAETYEIKNNMQKPLMIPEMADGMCVPKHWIDNKKKNNSIGDICVRDIAILSKYFEMPMEQIITGENPQYEQITETYGLSTSSLEWLKSKSKTSKSPEQSEASICSDFDFDKDEKIDYIDKDYINILNVILGNKRIAELLLGAIYTYCVAELNRYSDFGEVIPENLRSKSEVMIKAAIMDDIETAMSIIAKKYKKKKVKDINKKLKPMLANLNNIRERADEELQRIEDEERQDIEDFDREAQEYYKETHKQ